MADSSGPHDTQLEALFNFGLGYPGAHIKSPWPGHRDLAVKDKTFVYLSVPGEPLGVSCKLPASCGEALRLPFTSPTEYGLGKSGWVSASFAPGDEVPLDMLKAWIDESYRAQAPKRLSAGVPPLEPGSLLASEVKRAPPRKQAKKKAAKKTKAKRKVAARKAERRGASKRSSARGGKAAKRPRRKATAARRG